MTRYLTPMAGRDVPMTAEGTALDVDGHTWLRYVVRASCRWALGDSPGCLLIGWSGERLGGLR
jgi:hypothetical protein